MNKVNNNITAKNAKVDAKFAEFSLQSLRILSALCG
jgi:hypothetical protein